MVVVKWSAVLAFYSDIPAFFRDIVYGKVKIKQKEAGDGTFKKIFDIFVSLLSCSLFRGREKAMIIKEGSPRL